MSERYVSSISKSACSSSSFDTATSFSFSLLGLFIIFLIVGQLLSGVPDALLI
jgi:hypothetical protein